MKKTLICIFATVFTIILFNFFIDVTGRYYNQKKIVSEALSKLINNNYFYAPQNFHERILKKKLIEINKYKKTIICGSSRAAFLSGDLVKEENILNLAFSFSTIFDTIILCDYAYSKLNAEKMILVVDYYHFIDLDNKHFKYEWISLFSDNKFKKYKKEFTLQDYIYYNFSYKLTLLKNLLSYSLTKSNIEKFFFRNDFENDTLKIKSDGTFEVKEVKFDENNIQNLKDKKNYSNKHFKDANIINKKNLYFFKNYLEKNKKNIEVYFLPYSPIYYNILNKRKSIVILEKQLNNITKENSIKIIGSFNPDSLNCSENNFSDAVHPNKDCLKNIK